MLLEAAVEASPHYPDILRPLAVTQHGTGDLDGAKTGVNLAKLDDPIISAFASR